MDHELNRLPNLKYIGPYRNALIWAACAGVEFFELEIGSNDEVDSLRDLIWSSVWLATNERKYGERHHEQNDIRIQ